MLLPKEGGAWRAAPANAPIAGGSRNPAHYVTKTGLAIAAVFIGVFLLVCHGVNTTIRQMDRFYCWGPAAGPMDMTVNEHARWVAHLQTPVLFNHHIPVEVNSSTIRHVNLNTRESLSGEEDEEKRERLLILTPLRDAAKHLEHYFDLLALLSYPHHLIDLAFLVGDSTDDTLAILAKELERVQTGDLAPAFRSATIVEKGFGFALSQEVKDRHSYAAQAPRRKMMARARNYLLSVALKPEHAWVFWRDVDIDESPSTIIEDLIKHDRDVIVPNIWFHRYEMQRGRMTDIEGRFDYNSWQETPQSLKLTSRLGKDVILAEGYKEYITGRKYMATLGDWRADPDEEMPLDGIGGVSIMVRADVHRSGINFPSYAFENQAETEGFAKMAKCAGYGVYGLPNYIVWHVDTKEEPGNA